MTQHPGEPTLWDDPPDPTGILANVMDMAVAYQRMVDDPLALPSLHVGSAAYAWLQAHHGDYVATAEATLGFVPALVLVDAPSPALVWPLTRETPQLCTWCQNPTLAAAREHCEATRCPFATDTYLRNPAPPSPDGSMCAWPGCDCAGDEPVCEDYLTTNGTRRLMRLRAGEPCPVHDLPEPCPTCVDVVGMPF